MNSENTRTKPIPIRMDAVLRSRLDRAAKRLSSNRASVIRLAIRQILPEVESGHLILRDTEEAA